MSYTALYRKFRPSTFEEVKGQEHIVTSLKNQIKTGRIGHAYLFCGTRGTGKTSVAKILARAVNCENPVDGSPCNECEMCRKINAQTSLNVVEIDAASNNGVGNIRDIIEEVQYSPTEGRYKVYIIDEVHMLSAGAFNALLKTLEEPPGYVIFILATTEAHKIPVTILSRCQRYDFKRITVDTIAGRLRELVSREQADVEERALRYIAKAADGSMRDALSLLDQCLAFYIGQNLTYERALDVLGAVDTGVYSQMFRCIAEYDAKGCIELINRMMAEGRDLNQFINELIWYMRNLLLVGFSEDAENIVDASAEQMEQMHEDAALVDTDGLMRYIRVLSELSNQLRYGSQKRVLAEVAFIKLCRPQMEQKQDLTLLVQRLQQLEKRIEEGIPAAAAPAAGPVEEMEQEASDGQEQKILPKAVPEDIEKVIQNWSRIISQCGPVGRQELTLVKKTVDESGALVLQFTDAIDEGAFRQDGGQRLEELRTIIENTIGRKVDIVTRTVPPAVDEQYVDLENIIHFDGVEIY